MWIMGGGGMRVVFLVGVLVGWGMMKGDLVKGEGGGGRGGEGEMRGEGNYGWEKRGVGGNYKIK